MVDDPKRVDAVAKAICWAEFLAYIKRRGKVTDLVKARCDLDTKWERQTEEDELVREGFRKLARAAIEGQQEYDESIVRN